MYFTVVYAALLATSLIAAITDLRTGLIPNRLTVPVLVLAIAGHGLALGWDGACLALLGALICGATPFLFHRLGAMGGGDVKLFAAIGALVGPSIGFDVEARTFAFSLIVLFPYRLVRHRALGVALRNLRIGVVNLFKARAARVAYLSGPKLPPVILGPAIGVAFAITLLQYGVLR
jgi:prepilin peptidase CpaA